MAAISDCTKAINNMVNNIGDDKMQQLLQLAERAVQHYPPNTSASKLTPSTDENPRGNQPAPRVPPSGNQTQKLGFKLGGRSTTATTAAKQEP